MEINLGDNREASYLTREMVKNTTNNYKRKTYLTEDQMNLIKEAFDMFDIEKEGMIELYEVSLALKAFKFNASKEELKKLSGKYKIENGKISFNDYIDLMTDKFSLRDPKEEALLAFDLFDEEKKGKIGLKNLKKCVKELDEKINDQDLKAIIEEFDTDNDGYITRDEFLKILEEYYFN